MTFELDSRIAVSTEVRRKLRLWKARGDYASYDALLREIIDDIEEDENE